MIYFDKSAQHLLLTYEAEFGSPDWVKEKLRSGPFVLAHTFHFNASDVRSEPLDEKAAQDAYDDDRVAYTFVLGTSKGGYYKIAGAKLGIEVDVFLHSGLPIDRHMFTAYRNISIFRRVAELIHEDIYVGGDEAGAIPYAEFQDLLSKFPNTTEVNRYAQSRIARILKDYLGTMTDAEKSFEKYLQTRSTKTRIRPISAIYENELAKYRFIRDEITEFLRDEDSFGENQWRDLMLEFLLLIFPKYVGVLRDVRIKDFYSDPLKTKNRYIDVALVDANGHLDIVEIKKPFANCLVSEGRYRDNFTPRKELSGAVMQAEKYLFHLNKWGADGEREINQLQSRHLPPGITVRITNPRAMIIAGRSNNLTEQQIFDLQFMKRKYASIIDILSYDDLLARLSNIIGKFEVTL